MEYTYLLFVFFTYQTIFISNKGYCYDTTTIETFLREVQRRYLQASADIGNPDIQPEQLSRYSINLEAAVLHLKKIQWFLMTEKPCSDHVLSSLVDNLFSLEKKVGVIVHRLSSVATFLMEEQSYRAPTQESGVIGRPAYLISKEQLETMRSYGLKWIDIANSLGVSIATIWRRRVLFNMETRSSANKRRISKTELRGIIMELQETAPGIGIRMIEGQLRSRNLRSSRDDIAEVLRVLDPIGAIMRWREQVPRVTYQVPGPNSLWHVDGNHKLIRWRFVIHAAIDGYSRLVVYMKCSNNNKSSTVGELFLKATQDYCWPSRVRADKGTENVQVSRMMIAKHGDGRGSIILGSSVHNQRIERLWRDMRRVVTEYYRQLFFFMEENSLLDPSSDKDLFCLHFVYLPRINSALEKFQKGWNNHKLSTEQGRTPNQLYIQGMLRLFGSNYRNVNEFFESGSVDEERYGTYEPETEEVSFENIDNNVNVPTIELNLTPECLTQLRAVEENISTASTNHYIPMYVECRRIIALHFNNV